MEIDFTKYKKVYFIGIGGIGVSALARMMMLEGKDVSGSDRSPSEITTELLKEGATIFYEQKAENINSLIELVIYTVAIPEDNPELVKARELGIPAITYPQALGVISSHKYTIAVAGTHGKTTTTAMMAKVLMDAKLDPTVVVGSLLNDTQSNFVAGKGNILIAEACEYKRSFLNLHPSILVITNIDDDHLDYYKDIEDIKSAFIELILKIPADGYLVCDLEQPHIAEVAKKAKCTVVDYELFGDVNLKLKVPGEHNLNNAAAVLAVADTLGLKRKDVHTSLEAFSGTWRRFEHKGETKWGATVYDDYGHHPTEVKATLKGAREMFPQKKITVIFQPHLYSRTKQHLKEFGEAFGDVDSVIIAPIYAAREPNDPSISADMVAAEINAHHVSAMAFPSIEAIENHIKTSGTKGEVIMTMGAGDIYLLGEKLVVY
ncbi:MAG: UDP-N-acetylmuramate--L-alanine ligase [bacterium]|nr:UDP-N-acetylmuramate--L-alanine ligase [bacterium]